MSDTTKAVFLSYAHEDSGAARRVAEALRVSGLEVWFDENELRGGDQWDAKIRRQIRECALFLPVISATTQSRPEGYFRREWKLAVERSGDMAAGIAFIVPVVVDDTREADAVVPEDFMRVQWTRLPGALPTPPFVEHVRKLLASPRAGAAVGARTATPAPAGASPAKKTFPAALAITLGTVAVAVGVVLFVTARRPASVPAESRPTAPVPPAAEVKPAAVSDKSIAVLPFENRSEDKANAFFTDGIHEDILTNLARIAQLRVVSRTSVAEYRATTKKIRQIGAELGVAWILEGSVQRAGNKVRVTGQLINARTDEHVWAQSYDRDLTDIFAIQTELAKEIAGALKAALSPEEKNLLERRPTTNPAAYDLVLRARQIDRDGNDTRQELEMQESMLQSAVALDPGYAKAWAALAALHAQFRFNGQDVSEARLARAKAAIETAQKLGPELPEVIHGTGVYFYYGLRDYSRALEQFSRLVRQWPNDYTGYFMTGLVQRRQGRWVESLANLRLAAELDPGSAEHARNIMISLVAMRRYPAAILEQERRVRLLPESLRESFEVARLKFFLDGSTQEGDNLLVGPIATRANPAVAAGYRKLWAAMKGDLDEVVRLDREFPEAWAPGLGSGSGSPAEYALNNAVVLAAAGDLAGARQRVDKFPAELRARLVNEPQNALVLALLAQIEALLGHQPEARAAVQQAQEIFPETLDPLSGRGPHVALAFVLAWGGDKDAACAELRQLLATGGQPNVHLLKTGPVFYPLKGHPAFEALLADPKNNQPLF